MTQQDHRFPAVAAFTLMELFVTLSIIAVLTAVLLPVLGRAKNAAKTSRCKNQLRQIVLGVRMYADDSNDSGPARASKDNPLDGWTAYKNLIKSYVGARGVSSGEDKLFACPADTYHYDFTPHSTNAYAYIAEPVHRQAWSDYSSYGFNGGNTRTNKVSGESYPGIAGYKLSSIHNPSRTILVGEVPAFYPYSWHNSQNRKVPHYFNNAQNTAGFVDGHVDYLAFYWDRTKPLSESWQYDPPPHYGYKWSVD